MEQGMPYQIFVRACAFFLFALAVLFSLSSLPSPLFSLASLALATTTLHPLAGEPGRGVLHVHQDSAAEHACG